MKYIEAKTTEDLCRILGLPQNHAARIRMKVDLVVALRRHVQRHKWTQEEAARRARVGRTVMTAILNCKLAGISTDRLLDVAERLGLRFQLKVA
jgi:predicted XRE-type DNA-binding protein